MKIEVKKYLFDIKTSINSINDYIGGEKNFINYDNNKLLRRAVERELEIIGEATNRILKLESDIVIENARKIVDTRNWVIHAYDSVDNAIVWGIVTIHLPKLKIEVEKLLSEND